MSARPPLPWARAARMTRRGWLRRVAASLAVSGIARAGGAQGFAGLGTDAEGYAIPDRAPLTFPADHGPHPGFRIEWWYLTANLSDASGRDLGLQWTLFRSALRPPDADAGEGWRRAQIWLAHAAVTTPERHLHAERFARGGIGQAGVIPRPFEAWLDEWALTSRPDAPPGGDALDRLTVRASGTDFSYEVALTAEGPLVFQGEEGYSVKSPEGQASRYYSQPFYRAQGVLQLPEGPVEVTGQAWLDREWSSQPLSPTQEGWDWLSLHLDTGEKLMGFRLRDQVSPAFTAATHVRPGGATTPFPDGALRLTPLETAEVAGRTIPVAWRAELPERGIDVEARAVNPEAWMDNSFGYWEGPVRVSGSHGGRGYLEMTGYAAD